LTGDIRLAFSPAVIGEGFLKDILGADAEALSAPDFNTLAHLGFSPDAIKQAQIHACGTGDLDSWAGLSSPHWGVFRRADGLEGPDLLARLAMTVAAEAFTCAICMDKRPFDHLRVNVPCGHGFCKACHDDAWHAHGAPAAPECFTCRTKVASVLKAFV
jgi:ribonucleoside-diphosphate reductase alpha chain